MVAWPAGKRFVPLINSLQETPPANTIRSSMDRGPEKVRRRTTANIRPLSFKLLLEESDLTTMDSFFLDETYGGAGEFDYTHPRTGAAVKARFKEGPSYQERGGVGFYEVSISLEILP